VGGGRPRNKGEKLLEKKRANRTNDDDTDTVLSRSIATLAMHMLKIDAAHRENLSPDVKTTTTFFFFFRCKKNCNRWMNSVGNQRLLRAYTRECWAKLVSNSIQDTKRRLSVCLLRQTDIDAEKRQTDRRRESNLVHFSLKMRHLVAIF